MDKGFSVYLAGKITKNGWRHELPLKADIGYTDWSQKSQNANEVLPAWETIPNGLGDGIHLTGPFFVGCDHGCAHRGGAHGITGGCISSVATREATVKLCLDAIEKSDIVFAWIDTDDAYGTLVELGYAKGKGKRIIVAHPPETYFRGVALDESNISTRSDIWFLNTMADVEIAEHSAGAAWKALMDMGDDVLLPLGLL